MVLTFEPTGLAMASLCTASLIVVDGYSALSLALLRSNVVIPRRAAASPHCRTAERGQEALIQQSMQRERRGFQADETGGAMTAWPALSEA